MGVEYRHYLVVNDPDWRPEPDTAARVEKVLRSWALATRLARAVDLTGGGSRELPAASTSTLPGPGVAFVYEDIQGSAIARVAGPSLHDGVDDDERYLMKILLIVGHDYRVQWSSESLFFELLSPPTAGGASIEPNDDEGPFEIAYSASFPAEQATSPPVVRAQVEEHARHHVAWDDYQGFWRSAVVLDFGKDLPAFIEGRHALPEMQFVAALGEAFRGPLVEVGEFY
ncbi:MAG: hypothetical protein P4L99_17345 [Chthoniobacter sp.]|nr:hypothetical protein [Chthoniobacter sp.]